MRYPIFYIEDPAARLLYSEAVRSATHDPTNLCHRTPGPPPRVHPAAQCLVAGSGKRPLALSRKQAEQGSTSQQERGGAEPPHLMRGRHSAASPQTGELLEDVPVLQAILLGAIQGLRGVAVLVEVLGEAALAAGEVDEGDRLPWSWG